MNKISIKPTITLVVEWENAEGVGLKSALNALSAMCEQVRCSKQPINYPVRLLIVTADDEGLEDLKNCLDNQFANLRNEISHELVFAPGTNYYGKKGIGLAFATTDIVVVGDVDCKFSDHWFDDLVQPILAGKADMVHGFTLADMGSSWMEAASTLAWFFALPDKRDPVYAKTMGKFRANNFSIKTSAGHDVPIPHSAGSRAVGSLWIGRLKLAGYRLHFNENAKAFHKQYESFFELMKRAWLFGSDKDTGIALNNHGKLNRLFRAVSAMFELNIRYLARFFKVGVRRLPVIWWVPVFLVGLAFQSLAAISQLFHAVSGKKLESSSNYENLKASSRQVR